MKIKYSLNKLKYLLSNITYVILNRLVYRQDQQQHRCLILYQHQSDCQMMTQLDEL